MNELRAQTGLSDITDLADNWIMTQGLMSLHSPSPSIITHLLITGLPSSHGTFQRLLLSTTCQSDIEFLLNCVSVKDEMSVLPVGSTPCLSVQTR